MKSSFIRRGTSCCESASRNEHHSLPWTNPRAGAHVVRAALNMLRHQVDEGASCPLTMTFAVVPSLRLQPELAAEWLPRILSDEYDPRVYSSACRNAASCSGWR